MNIPNEIICHILLFLRGIVPVNKKILRLSKTNIVWKYKYNKVFKPKLSINYYEEYKWALLRKKHLRQYQASWTLGCVGKFKPIDYPKFLAAEHYDAIPDTISGVNLVPCSI